MFALALALAAQPPVPAPAEPPAESEVGEPIGLLLALTHAD